jgi:hypothetical protein
LPEPRTLLYGQHFTVGEISRLVDKFTDPLPEAVLNMLYRETEDIMGVVPKASRIVFLYGRKPSVEISGVPMTRWRRS